MLQHQRFGERFYVMNAGSGKSILRNDREVLGGCPNHYRARSY